MKLFTNRVIALIIDSLLIGIPVGIIEMAFSLIRCRFSIISASCFRHRFCS